jgi:glycine oxidase
VERTDIVVIGAGVIGSAIAWRLAQRGSRVILLDRGEPGTEASWAAAGVLIPSAGEVASPLFQLYRASHAAYPGFVEEVRQSSGAAFEYRACGHLVLAFDDAEAELLTRRATYQHVAGRAAHPRGGPAARARHQPGAAVRAALSHPQPGG